MHVRVRAVGKPEKCIFVDSTMSKIEHFRLKVQEKFGITPESQILLYGGKQLEDGYTFFDYRIKLNDVIQLMERPANQNSTTTKEKATKTTKQTSKPTVDYKDAFSTLYAVGDLVDVRDTVTGAWNEGEVIRIIHDPSRPIEVETTADARTHNLENQPPDEVAGSSKAKGVARYFTRITSLNKQKANKDKNIDEKLWFEVQMGAGDENSTLYCKLQDVRPRARTILDVKELKIGQTVMLNYNPEEPSERGLWYDCKISELGKMRKKAEIIGTIYFGSEAVPQHDTRIKVIDNIYQIEKPVPVEKRTDSYKTQMAVKPPKRTKPLNCLTCRDNENAGCKECGCFICLLKTPPEKIILCDECDYGYHMQCLSPPLEKVPEDDWYCPSCKRDPNEVIAPGAAKQAKKATKGKKDWGRGMACVGKTKTCVMPPNHFGPIPGIEVGMCWRFRIQLSESGVHRPPVSGIHGRDTEGAYSIVLAGGYEDDVDYGYEFTYSGSGGRDLSGNKRTAEQSSDQKLTRENKALARNCAVSVVDEKGGDAGDNWRNGKPVRVVRSYKMLKHAPKYAPTEGIRYDGIYKVVKYYPEVGLSGFKVWKYLLRRDDPSPAPWEPGVKQYAIIYPDGYLEAEAEKKALKGEKGKGKETKCEKGRMALRDLNKSTDSDNEVESAIKKKKVSNTKIIAISKKSSNKKSNAQNNNNKDQLSPEIKDAITMDVLNNKLWDECLLVFEENGKKAFVDHVMEVYKCIICQEVAASPVTTSCLHNFCLACIKRAFKTQAEKTCPTCRNNLAGYDIEINKSLQTSLQTILTGYDADRS